ncbi:MAG TPA: PAS domain S-box protein [Flavipsychrobacter sp.]|nr:PAS domain S-box protein [Flavipsychrobacter sp.]
MPETKNSYILGQNSIENQVAYLAAIVQSSEDAIISKTLEGIVTSWNRSAERILGYTAEEMIGQSITKIIPTDRLNEEPEILEKLKRGIKVSHFETIRKTKDGKLIDLSLTISPVKDKDGKIIGASKIARDITAQKNIERLAKESEERFRIVADTAPVMIWMDDAEKNCIFLNKGWLDFTGGALPDELDFGWLRNIHPDDIERRTQIYNTAFDSQQEYYTEYRLRRHDGTYRWVAGKGVPRYAPDGTFLGYIGGSTDIHEQHMAKKELERIVNERTKELLQMNEQLMKKNHELEQFAYIASHDLQEPLRKIQTFSELIQSNLHNKEVTEKYFEKITSSSQRMSTLITAVLNYSRLDAIDNSPVEVDLNDTLNEIITDFELLIKEKNAVIHSNILPTVKGISLQLQQLFANLIGNSLKFCVKKPEIHIYSKALSATELQHYPLLRKGKYEKIIFSDNGIGFEQKYAERIFAIFQRLNDNYSGTGIGLALCKKIIENHHGDISVTSTPGKGTIFTIILPVA